jgi:hypothetical protein
MNVFVLVAKSTVAVMLLVAGGAKLADVAGFAATVRLFIPRWMPRAVRDVVAFGIALVEISLGGASLSLPGILWVNPAVLALAVTFVAVSAAGLAFYKGRSCRCFGALSRRTFDSRGLLRSIGIAMLAAVATISVQPASIDIGTSAQVMLIISAGLLTLAAFTAAHALAVARESDPGLPGRAAR